MEKRILKKKIPRPYSIEGTEEEIKQARNTFLREKSKEISKVANGTTAMDALKKANPLLALGRVLKGVDDSMIDPSISRFKNLMRKIKSK